MEDRDTTTFALIVSGLIALTVTLFALGGLPGQHDTPGRGVAIDTASPQ
jgi:hypothetical protein